MIRNFPTISDVAIHAAVEQARRGDRTLAGDLAVALGPYVHARVRSLLRDADPIGDDLSQDVLLAVLTGVGRLLRPTAPGLRCWVDAIIRKRVASWQRRRLHRELAAGEEVTVRVDPGAHLTRRETRRVVLRAVGAEDRVLLLHAMRGGLHRYQTRRGLRVEAVRMRLCRVRAHLVRRLAEAS